MKKLLSVSFLLVACGSTTTVVQPAPAADAGPATPDEMEPATVALTRVDGKSDTLFEAKATTFAMVRDVDGVVASLGVVIPLAAFTSAPDGSPYQDDLVLDMPKVARDQTVMNHLRLNWLTSGHSPAPYGEPHFDLHFLRDTVDLVDAYDCRGDMRLPEANQIPSGYGSPTLCTNAQGYHSFPNADKGKPWTGSLIMGYFGGKLAFIEPMITKAKLLEKKNFELAVPKPASAGGAHALYPTHMTATFDAASAAYTFEFDGLEEID